MQGEKAGISKQVVTNTHIPFIVRHRLNARSSALSEKLIVAQLVNIPGEGSLVITVFTVNGHWVYPELDLSRSHPPRAIWLWRILIVSHLRPYRQSYLIKSDSATKILCAFFIHLFLSPMFFVFDFTTVYILISGI
jgi:hypothetical protein